MTRNYAGTTHGLLTVISRSGTDISGRAVWACQCSCGSEVSATSKQLTKGYKSGCKQCQDSGSKSPLSVRLRKYKIADDGCWNWTGKQNADGYGCIQVDRVYTGAHRAMYFMLNPEADRDLVVMHTCDNPRCINPEHLLLGTQKDNMMDMHKKGRFKGGAPIGNKNAKGNRGWTKGGVTAKYFAIRLGNVVDVPKELT